MGFCKICKRTWNGKSECHCSECCNHFKSLSGFDKHRSGKPEFRHCLTTEQMESRGMVWIEDEKGGCWVTGIKPDLAYGEKNKAKTQDEPTLTAMSPDSDVPGA